MDWTDCAVIEQVPGRMSGAPVVRGTRVRPQDILGNAGLGADWIADAHGLPLSDVCAVLDFYNAHREALPLEYFSPERIDTLGVDRIDWSLCAATEELGGQVVIRGTSVRPIDLIGNLVEGEESLAYSYSLPRETVRSVLGYYERCKSQFASPI